MPIERVMLCLSEQPSEMALTLARVIKATLDPHYQVFYRIGSEVNDPEITPVDLKATERLLTVIILDGKLTKP